MVEQQSTGVCVEMFVKNKTSKKNSKHIKTNIAIKK
jgi:hypothetical protein